MAKSRFRPLLEFAETRVPGTLTRYPEVSTVQLDMLLGACPPAITAAVPALEVLRWLGGSDDSAISVFGATYTTSISAMLDDLEFQVVANRFFRVAIDRNAEQMTQEDLYIDLAQSDGDDAPLISILEEWNGKAPPARGHTIISSATRRIFRDFGIGQENFLGYVAKYSSPSEGDVRWEEYSERMTALAERMGIAEVFAGRPDLRCYVTNEFMLMFDALGASIQSPGGAVEIWIGADSRTAFLNLAAQIRSAMPPLPTVDEWRTP